MDYGSNPIVSRVQDGTAFSGTDLCQSCRWAMIRKGSITGFRETRCGCIANSPLVPAKLATCTMYLEKGKMTLQEMDMVAWIVESRGKQIGFLSPEELERRRMNGVPDSSPRVGF